MSLSVHISVKNSDPGMLKSKRAHNNFIMYGVADTADAILAESQYGVPVRKGMLKKSGNVRYNLSSYSARVGYNTPYARWVEEGTPAHIIRPRFKRALSWPEARHPVKIVHHPGTRAYRYLANAVNTVVPQIPAIFANAWRRAFREQGEKEKNIGG